MSGDFVDYAMIQMWFQKYFDFIVPHDNNKSWQITPM